MTFAAARTAGLIELSQFLGFAPQHIFYLAQGSDRLYFRFSIPKSNGGERKIVAPRQELKGVQKVILEKLLADIPVSSHCAAYVKGKSVVDAARQITGGKAVLNMDIKDFFPSISARRIFGLFRSYHFSTTSSYILTQLTTYKGALAQGAPTSPYLSNLIFQQADIRLAGLAEMWSLSYLRYSDDLYLFGPRDFRHKILLEPVRRIIRESGFELNTRKTKYFRCGTPRFTLGLQTAGSKPEFSRHQKRLYRAAFFNASHRLSWGRENLSQLRGMAEWHKSVYGADETYREYQNIIRNIQSLRLHDVYSTR